MEQLKIDLADDRKTREDQYSKTFFLCPAQTLTEIPNLVSTQSRYFGLFLAVNAKSVPSQLIGNVANQLLSAGLAYLCAWGPDCERVHDIFDEEVVSREIKAGKPIENILLTTWHHEPLSEATCFFIYSAWPDKGFEDNCRDWVFAPVGNANWEEQIRKYVSGK